jgi:hypothetical protein
MTTPTFEIVEHGMEDDFEFLVNGESMARVTHDSHGWSGIELAKDTFRGIAEQLGVEVNERMADE